MRKALPNAAMLACQRRSPDGVNEGGREVSATKRQLEPAFRGRSEFFEVLLRIKRDQPRRYHINVSTGMQRRVEIYESLKREREGRKLT